jgi:uncharacterized membrane protein YphA (DoxX/SURF4 family)
LYTAVLFLQSGLDKVTDRAGNVSYIGGFFEKTPSVRWRHFCSR